MRECQRGSYRLLVGKTKYIISDTYLAVRQMAHDMYAVKGGLLSITVMLQNWVTVTCLKAREPEKPRRRRKDVLAQKLGGKR